MYVCVCLCFGGVVVVLAKQFLLDLELSNWRTLQEYLKMGGNCGPVLVLSLGCLLHLPHRKSPRILK